MKTNVTSFIFILLFFFIGKKRFLNFIWNRLKDSFFFNQFTTHSYRKKVITTSKEFLLSNFTDIKYNFWPHDQGEKCNENSWDKKILNAWYLLPTYLKILITICWNFGKSILLKRITYAEYKFMRKLEKVIAKNLCSTST